MIPIKSYDDSFGDGVHAMEARCVWPAQAALGEGPIWIPEEQALYWLDIMAPAIYRYVPETGDRRSWTTQGSIGCIAPREGGGFVAGMGDGIWFLDLEPGKSESIARPEQDRSGNRMNDGKCDAAGRFWVGSMHLAEREPRGALYRLDPDLSAHRLDDGYVITNGPAFSPDGRTLYHTDTLERTIYAFDLAADGSLSQRRPFVQIPKDQGYPDGMTVDSEGGLWVAHFGGARVTRFMADGRPERVVELPASNVTSCAFGGPDLDVLYVTTATKGIDPEFLQTQPLAGGLFELSVGVQGLPVVRFAA